MRFKDIFVLQIIGSLTGHKYSGRLDLKLDKGTASIWFELGEVMGIDYLNLPVEKILPLILWQKQGELNLNSGTLPTRQTCQNYPALLEKNLVQHALNIPELCPILMYMSLERFSAQPIKSFQYSVQAMQLLKEITGHISVAKLNSNLPPLILWHILLFLMGTGVLRLEYETPLMVLLRKIQEEMVNKTKKFMGSNVANTYQERLQQKVEQSQQEWVTPLAKEISGTALLVAWIADFNATNEEVGSISLQRRNLESTLQNLSSTENQLYRYLTA